MVRFRAGRGPGARPAGRGDLARLVEDATLGARERERLVGVDLAALEALPAGRRPHHVVAAILVDGHSPFWPSRQAAVASRARGPDRRPRRPPQDAAALERGPVGHRPHRAGVHREPLRAGALRGDPQGGRPTSGPRRTGEGDDPDAGGLVQEWMDTVGKGVPGYVTPKVAVGRGRRQRPGRAAADSAGRLGHLALPDRLVRRRLLGRRGRGQGGRGGDRHHRRAGPPHRGARRPAPRLHAGARCTRSSSTAAPWAASSPRTRSRPATWVGSPARRCRTPWSARIAGASTSSRPSTVSAATSSTTACANRCGGATSANVVIVRRGRRVGRRRPRARRWRRSCPSSPGPRRRPPRTELERIVADPGTTLFVARDGGRIVGMLTLAVFTIPTAVRAWIEDVVVDEGSRGSGVAAALVQAALDRADACGGAHGRSHLATARRQPALPAHGVRAQGDQRLPQRSTPELTG